MTVPGGLFDDLIPKSPAASGGLFDDLVPQETEEQKRRREAFRGAGAGATFQAPSLTERLASLAERFGTTAKAATGEALADIVGLGSRIGTPGARPLEAMLRGTAAGERSALTAPRGVAENVAQFAGEMAPGVAATVAGTGALRAVGAGTSRLAPAARALLGPAKIEGTLAQKALGVARQNIGGTAAALPITVPGALAEAPGRSPTGMLGVESPVGRVAGDVALDWLGGSALETLVRGGIGGAGRVARALRPAAEVPPAAVVPEEFGALRRAQLEEEANQAAALERLMAEPRSPLSQAMADFDRLMAGYGERALEIPARPEVPPAPTVQEGIDALRQTFVDRARAERELTANAAAVEADREQYRQMVEAANAERLGAQARVAEAEAQAAADAVSAPTIAQRSALERLRARRGSVNPILLTTVARTAAGGLAGAAVGDTPEERAAFALAGATGTLTAPSVIRRLVRPADTPITDATTKKLLAVWKRANPKIEALAAEYMGDAAPRPLARATTLDRPFTTRIAQWFDSAVSAPNDPAVQEAYRAFADETRRQYEFLLSRGITFEFVDADPYKNSAEMMRDVAENNRLKVLKTEAGMHPLLTEEENDMFRAVHDFFGHAKEGHQFGQLGEENAYRVHSAMYSPQARPAMATETRGQNSWVNNQPANVTKPGSVYAEQKVALMPEEFLGEYPIERVVPEVVTNVEFQSKLTPGLTNAEVKSLSGIERRFGRAAFIRKVVEPIVRSEGLPVTVAKGLGSWLSEGDPGITEAARLSFSQMSPMAIQRVLSRVSLAARQMGFFFSVPNPEGRSVAVTLDFGRGLKEQEYKYAIERLTTADNGQLFNGTTMVKLDPAKVQIVLNDGVDEQGAESLLRLVRQVLPQYNTRGTVQRVESFFPNDVEKLDDAFAEYLSRIGYLTPEQAQAQQRAIIAYGQLAQAGPVRRALAAGAPAIAEAAGELGRAGLRRVAEVGTGPTAIAAGRAGLGALAGIAATPAEAGAQGQEGVGRLGPSALLGAAALAGPRALRGRAALGAVGSVLSQSEDERLQTTGYQLMGLAAASFAYPQLAKASKYGGVRVRDALAQTEAGRKVLNTLSYDILADPRVKQVVESAVEEMARYRAVGQQLAAEARRLGPQGDRVVSDLVERENFEQVMTPDEMAAATALANRVADAVQGLGQAKADLGLISRETLARRERTYLRRMYGTVEGEQAAEAAMGPEDLLTQAPQFGQRKTFRIQGEGVRKDLTPEQRMALGEIREASYRIAETFGRGGRDVATARLFTTLVDLPGAVEPRYKQAFDAAVEAKAARDAARSGGDAEASRQANQAYLAARQQMAQIADEFAKGGAYVKMPDTPALGVLRGAVVRKDVADYLNNVPSFGNTQSVWNNVLSAWKKIHTVYNPGTHVGNFVSNAAMVHMGGLPVPMQPMYLAKAARGLKNYDADVKFLTEAGVLERGLPLYGDVPVKGLAEDRAVLRTLARTTRPETRAALERQGVRAMGGTELFARRVGAGVEKAYALEDGVYRVALFKRLKATGLSSEEAANQVMRVLPGYDTRSPLLKAVKSTVSPFVLYPAKYIPAALDLIMQHPERWVALAAIWGGMDQMSRRKYEPLEQKDLPPNQRGLGYLLPGRIQVDAVVRPAYEALGIEVPAGDKYTFDVARWTPFSALTGSPAPGAIATQLSEDIPAIFQPGGPVQDIGALMVNRDPFTGEQVLRPGMTTGEKVTELGKRAAGFVLPSAASFQIPRVIKDMQRGDTAAAALDALGLVGLRPSVVKPGLQGIREQRKHEEAIRNIRYDIRSELRRNRNPERAEALIEQAREKIRKENERYSRVMGVQ